jgi:tetratricopeptide (TPR) repeat protein
MKGEEKIKKGIFLVENGKIDEGLSLINQAIAEDPKDPEKIHLRAQIFESSRKYNQAIIDYKKAIFLKNDVYQYHYNLGNVYLDTANYELAVEYYSNAQKLNPYDFDIYFNRGLCYIKLYFLPLAYYDFTRALEMDPVNEKKYTTQINIIKVVKPDISKQISGIRNQLHGELYEFLKAMIKSKEFSNSEILEFYSCYTVDFINNSKINKQDKKDMALMLELTLDFISKTTKNLNIELRNKISADYYMFLEKDIIFIDEYRKRVLKTILPFAD